MKKLHFFLLKNMKQKLQILLLAADNVSLVG